MSTERSDENDPLDQRWFEVDSDKWAEVVRILERAPEPKPRLADLLRERSMFASQQGCHCGMPDTASEIPGSAIIHGPYACKTDPTTPHADDRNEES